MVLSVLSIALVPAALIPAVEVDIQARRLPRGWLRLAGLLVLPAPAGTPLFPRRPGGSCLDSIASAVAGAVCAVAVLELSRRLVPGGLGRGDIRMAAVMGLSLGFPAIYRALGAAVLLCALVLVPRPGRQRRRDTAFGPFLLTGHALVAAWQLAELLHG